MGRSYTVRLQGRRGLDCTCKDYMIRRRPAGGKCKHMRQAEAEAEAEREAFELFGVRGVRRARSQCRSVLPPIHFTPDSLTYSVPLF